MTFEAKQINGHKDPIGPGKTRGSDLFERMSREASGSNHEDVVSAAANLIVNALRQQCPTAKKAEQAYDELSATIKGLLLDQHYYPAGGRRNVYPHNQILGVPFIDAKKM